MKDYLIHYGVPGMKWGVRKSPQVSSSRQAYKQAKKDYSNAYHKAYNYSSTHPIRQHIKGSKWKAESQRRWTDAIDKAEAVKNARKDYKQTKNRVKAENYRDKLVRRADRREKSNIDFARDENRKYKDIQKYGASSETWREHRNFEYDMKKSYMNGYEKTMYLLDSMSDSKAINYSYSLKDNRDRYSSQARQWASRRDDLKNMKISGLTTKEDIKKVYRGH